MASSQSGRLPTDKQMEVLVFLIQHIEEHGYQPSQHEMSVRFGVTKNAIAERLKELEKKGVVRLTGSRERAVEIQGVRFEAKPRPSGSVK